MSNEERLVSIERDNFQMESICIQGRAANINVREASVTKRVSSVNRRRASVH